MPTDAFRIDISQMTTYFDRLGANGPKVLKDELNKAMLLSTQHVEDAAKRRVKMRSGNYGRSFRRVVNSTSSGVVGIVTNNAASAKGFVYAFTLENGRGPVFAKPGHFLRFEIAGQVFYRKSVGPAPAQHPMEFGLRDAEPEIQGAFAAVTERAVARLEAL